MTLAVACLLATLVSVRTPPQAAEDQPTTAMAQALARARAEALVAYAERARRAILDARAALARLDAQVQSLEAQLNRVMRRQTPLTATDATKRIARLRAELDTLTDGAAPAAKADRDALIVQAERAVEELFRAWPTPAPGALAPGSVTVDPGPVVLLDEIDCARRNPPAVLTLICDDPTLRKLNETHVSLYQQLLGSLDIEVELRVERQRWLDWLNRLSMCADGDAPGQAGTRRQALACLYNAYVGRIEALKRRLTQQNE